MTKTFCGVCGKELSAFEQMNSYNVAITSKKQNVPYSVGKTLFRSM